jgi:hypothetical protein
MYIYQNEQLKYMKLYHLLKDQVIYMPVSFPNYKVALSTSLDLQISPSDNLLFKYEYVQY